MYSVSQNCCKVLVLSLSALFGELEKLRHGIAAAAKRAASMQN